jgi:hypothetical protein
VTTYLEITPSLSLQSLQYAVMYVYNAVPLVRSVKQVPPNGNLLIWITAVEVPVKREEPKYDVIETATFQ